MVLINADAKLRTKKEDDTLSYCKKLSEEISKTSDIPSVCTKYPDLIQKMTARIDEKNAAIATQGMRAGMGNETRAARRRGSLTPAQHQRRFTQTRRFSKNDN